MARKSTPRKSTPGKSAATAVAAYTMYGGTPVRPAIRQWWAGIAARLKDAGLTDVPARPSFDTTKQDLWHAPNLLLAQACGYPLMRGDTGPVRLVATPLYDVPFTDGVNYCSLVVVAKDDPATSLADLRGRRAAVNEPASHSGTNTFRRLVADYVVQWEAAMGGDIDDLAGGRRFFQRVTETGSHLNSLKAVAGGKADVAAIDCVSHYFITREAPDLAARTRILTATAQAPGLPLITAHWRPDTEVDLIRRAVMDTLGDASLKEALATLRIKGFQVLKRGAYQVTLDMERQAQDRNYPILR